MRPSLFIVQRYIRDKLFTEMRSLIPETRDRLSGFVQNQTDCQGSYRNLTVVFQTFFENFYVKFQDFPYFSRICTNPGLWKNAISRNVAESLKRFLYPDAEVGNFQSSVRCSLPINTSPVKYA